MTRDDAIALWKEITSGRGTGDFRDEYAERFARGRMAKDHWHEPEFTLGVEYGILIALMLAFDLTPEDGVGDAPDGSRVLNPYQMCWNLGPLSEDAASGSPGTLFDTVMAMGRPKPAGFQEDGPLFEPPRHVAVAYEVQGEIIVHCSCGEECDDAKALRAEHSRSDPENDPGHQPGPNPA